MKNKTKQNKKQKTKKQSSVSGRETQEQFCVSRSFACLSEWFIAPNSSLFTKSQSQSCVQCLAKAKGEGGQCALVTLTHSRCLREARHFLPLQSVCSHPELHLLGLQEDSKPPNPSCLWYGFANEFVSCIKSSVKTQILV